MLLPVGIYLGLNVLNYGVAYGCHLFTKARLKKDGYEYRKMDTPVKDKLARLGSRAALLSMPVLHILTPILVPVCDYLSYGEYKDFLIEERLVKKVNNSSNEKGISNTSKSKDEKPVQKLLYVDKVNNVAYVEREERPNVPYQNPRVLRKTFRPRFLNRESRRTNKY